MREKSKPMNQTIALHDKQEQIEQEITTEAQNPNKVSQVSQRLILADEKIMQIKKRREKLQSQQALLFFKESQKIFNTEFSTDSALKILKEGWQQALETQKKQRCKNTKNLQENYENDRKEKRRILHIDITGVCDPFRGSSSPSSQQEDSASQSTHLAS